MPILSIIIPTHNRQEYAVVAVNKIIAECRDVEIVVSDTSEDDSLRQMLDSTSKIGKVTYVRQPRGMDVVSHFEAARLHATGEFLIFIGDDDCVGPEIENIATWAKATGIDAVVSYRNKFIANYYWPGVRSKYYGNQYAGKLFLHRFSSRAWPIDGRDAIRGALRDLGRGLGAMPRAYHGLVSKTLVDKVVARYGALFGGVSPDIYSAILISKEAVNPWCVDFPFCLPGGSAPSTAGSGAAHSDTPKLDEHSHIRPFKNLVWDPIIPKFYSPYNVWSLSAKKAVDRLQDDAFRPNYPRLYACCLMYGRDYGNSLREAIKVHVGEYGRAPTYWAILAEVARETAFQAKRLARRALSPRAGGEADSIGNLRTIADAYDEVRKRYLHDDASPQLPRL